MRKLTIENMDELAAKIGGKCLSRIYINGYTKLEWECDKGHRWWSMPSHIKSGQWCPYCAGNAKLTVNYTNKFANRRNGIFISETYTNVQTKHKWGCLKCYSRFRASYTSIEKRKYFCKTCRSPNKVQTKNKE